MFSRYYQSELTYLRELGREFAAANPALAGLFAERGADPDIDRLLEGFAFLTARIRERLDDAFPEVIEHLCQLALPQYVRSWPAASVIEFTPQPRALKGVHRIARGAELGARPIDGTSCRFRTTRDLDLLPLALQAASMDATTESSPRIRLSMQTTEIGAVSIPAEGSIRFFLHGGLGQTSTLFLWLTTHLKGVAVESNGVTTELGADCLRFTTIADGGSTYPWPDFAPDDVRLVLEYYSMPSLLLFFDVQKLQRVQGKIGTSFDLVFQFDRAPKLPERIERDAFRLHCVPAVNLFDTSSEPIRRDLGAHEYLLRPAGVSPVHGDIFSINKVIGARPKSAPVEYDPYFQFGHMNQPEGDGQRFYWARRALSPIDGGLDTYLSVGHPRESVPPSVEETISTDITCTNRNLPTELRVGDISVPTQRSPMVAPFKNIVPVTRPVRPPIGSELAWRFIAHIAVNQRTLSDPKALRAILSLYNFHEGVDAQLGRANRLRVEGIRSVEMGAAKRLLDHIPTRGVRTTIEVDEAAFATIGDLHLFGCTLDAFFVAQAPVNTFHELAIVAHPSGRVLSWTPRSGIEPIY